MVAGSGSLLVFFLLTYAVMWACFITVAAAVPVTTPLGRVLVLLGAYSPSLVALWLTLRNEGRAGVRGLLRRVVQWRVAGRWYLFAIGYTVAIKLTVAVIYRVATGAWPRFGSYSYGQSFFVFVLQIIPISAALAWLYDRTKGSLLLPMLLHAGVNNSDIVPSATPGATNPFGLDASLVAWLTVALLWIVAAFILYSMARAESEPGRNRTRGDQREASSASIGIE